MRKLILCLSFCICYATIQSQVYSDKVLSEKRKAVVDSVADDPYPYLLPIWGKKVIERGYDIPYSAGLGINYITQESDIVVNNLLVGFNNSELIPLDEYIRFPSAVANSTVINIRPDIWLFPFLNVYGIIARVDSSTEIEAVLSLPNQDSFEDIFEFGTKVDFAGTSTGFGITPTMGVAGGWIALDMNFTWTDIEELQDPVYTFVFGPRIGKTFYFNKPEKNLAVWVGGFRVNINNNTAGSLPFDQVFEFDGSFQQKIDNGMEAVITKQQELDDWFNSLSPPQQVVNTPKYQALSAILGAANNFLFRLEEAGQRIADSTVQYSIDKKQANLWNFVIGAQYQFNKHLMLRAEYGFLGTRTQFIGGLQYRFRL